MIIVIAEKLVGLVAIDLGRGRAILYRDIARVLAHPVVHGLEGERRIGMPLSETSRVGAMKVRAQQRSCE